MGKGKFIVIEGCEGAGKTTQCKRLHSALTSRGVDAVVTREPGGTPMGEQIRALLLDPKYSPDAVTELYLYSASRRVNLNEKIFPLLEAGKTVICDRFIYSTVAYQGYARGLDPDFVREVNRKTIEPLKVDLALFIDIAPEAGFIRKGGADKSDRLERESLEFFGKVYRGFSDMCKLGEMVRVDGLGTEDEVAALILKEAEKVL
ncbi:MAG: dTMP kinase [Clostridiales bacterium]|nr:dTMP kinase [Clostridiales bacterium]